MRVRKALGAACATAAILLVFACSSSSARPPVEGCQGSDCVGGGGGAGSSSSSGGVSGDDASTGDDATTGPCGVPANASQCETCVAQRTSCCSDLQTCIASTTCRAMLGCVSACGGGSTCVNECCTTYPTECGTYQQISTCEQSCQPCVESGVGDACGGLSYPCAANLTCNGSWCTRTCNMDSDCAGIGPGGGNYLSFPNRCIHTSAGNNTCAPGCMVPQDCSGFPGATCVVAMDAATAANVFVCGALGDAAAGG